MYAAVNILELRNLEIKESYKSQNEKRWNKMMCKEQREEVDFQDLRAI